jgi:hypothetical protein
MKDLSDHVRVWCDCPEWFQPKRNNWLNFSLVDLSCEWDRMFRTFKVTVTLLGFHVRLTVPVSKPNAEGERVHEMVRGLCAEAEKERA